MLWMLLPAGIFTADCFLKKKAEEWKEEKPQHKILKGRIFLHRYHNRGAALNFMEDRPGLLIGCTAGMTVGLAAGYVWLIWKESHILLRAGTGMILGGAMSNVWDRLHRHYVVDYFSFDSRWESLRNIVFNLSDMFIFMGVFLISLWNIFRKS